MSNKLYVSPHLDDAPFSCGGKIDRDVQNGDYPLVLNIFTADPPAAISELARKYHSEWANGDKSYEVRREEDREAMQALRCQYRNLDLFDGIYRLGPNGESYLDDRQLFAKVSPEWDLPVRERIEQTVRGVLADTRWDQVYLPLGLGGNVDHLQVREAVLSLFSNSDSKIFFYEEIPYAMGQYPWPGYDNVAAAIERLDRKVQAYIEEVDFDRKAASILAYGSQLAGLFGSSDRAVEMVREYGQKLGGKVYAERCYLLM